MEISTYRNENQIRKMTFLILGTTKCKRSNVVQSVAQSDERILPDGENQKECLPSVFLSDV